MSMTVLARKDIQITFYLLNTKIFSNCKSPDKHGNFNQE